MLVKCIKSFRHQVTENIVYLVVEIIINISRKRTSYRIIDNSGYPAIYDYHNFKITSNRISDFAVSINDDEVIFSHEIIINSNLNEKNIDGFWGLYIESDTEAKEILKDVVDVLSSQENIPTPELE